MKDSFDNLCSFVRRQVELGKLGANSAQSYLTSIDRVFESATDVEKADVLGIDLDALFTRFRKNAGIQSNTIASYEGRVKAALNSFAKRNDAPGDEGAPRHMYPTMGTLTIPMRSGYVSIDGLPSDLTEAEARRVGAMIVAMAS